MQWDREVGPLGPASRRERASNYIQDRTSANTACKVVKRSGAAWLECVAVAGHVLWSATGRCSENLQSPTPLYFFQEHREAPENLSFAETALALHWHCTIG